MKVKIQSKTLKLRLSNMTIKHRSPKRLPKRLGDLLYNYAGGQLNDSFVSLYSGAIRCNKNLSRRETWEEVLIAVGKLEESLSREYPNLAEL